MGLRKWIAESALVSGTRQTLPTELFAGVEKPSVTLAKMFVAEMLQNIDVDGNHITSYTKRYKFPSFAMCICDTSRPDDPRKPSISSIELKNGHLAPFGGGEQTILLDGWHKWKELNDQYNANKAENARQDKALDIIANILKVKE